MYRQPKHVNNNNKNNKNNLAILLQAYGYINNILYENKTKKQLYGRIHSIKLPHSSKTPSLAEGKFCKKFPSVFSCYSSNETIHVVVMNEAFFLLINAFMAP